MSDGTTKRDQVLAIVAACSKLWHEQERARYNAWVNEWAAQSAVAVPILPHGWPGTPNWPYQWLTNAMDLRNRIAEYAAANTAFLGYGNEGSPTHLTFDEVHEIVQAFVSGIPA